MLPKHFQSDLASPPGRRLRSMLRAIVLGTWLILMLPIASGCDPGPIPTAGALEPRTVDVIEVRTEPDRETFQLIGRMEPWQEVTLYFEVPGVVAQVLVEEGDAVAPGDPIARLVLDDYQLAVSRAQAELSAAQAEWDLLRAGTRQEDIDLARADYERAKARHAFWIGEFSRTKKAVETKAVSESEYRRVWQEHDAAAQEEQMARATLQRALAGYRKEEIETAGANVRARTEAVRLAQRQLEKATLRAPLRGGVERRLVDPGAYVNVFPMGGVPVVHLVDLENVDAVIAVPEAMLPRFAVGQQIEIRSAVNARVRASGKVIHVGQVADRASGTYEVRARMPNPDRRFTGGMVVVAEVQDAAPRSTIRIPVTAIRRAYGQPPYVLLVSPDDSRVDEREVELGPITGNQIEIVNGLRGGELLVVRGQHLVVAGDQVHFEAFEKVPIAQKPGPPP